jgi:hypothetical protein
MAIRHRAIEVTIGQFVCQARHLDRSLPTNTVRQRLACLRTALAKDPHLAPSPMIPLQVLFTHIRGVLSIERALKQKIYFEHTVRGSNTVSVTMLAKLKVALDTFTKPTISFRELLQINARVIEAAGRSDVN